MALHFETGYLALVAVGVFPWLSRAGLAKRLQRAGVTLALVAALCAWVLVPLLVFDKWAAISQVLVGTPLENGYGGTGSWVGLSAAESSTTAACRWSPSPSPWA